MEDVHRHQFPSFGNWDMNGNMPITQYFESARQAGLHRKLTAEEPVWDLYAPVPTIYRFKGNGRVKRVQNVKETWKQGRVCHVAEGTAPASPIPAPVRAPKAVDEDLYKIPSELLRKKSSSAAGAPVLHLVHVSTPPHMLLKSDVFPPIHAR